MLKNHLWRLEVDVGQCNVIREHTELLIDHFTKHVTRIFVNCNIVLVAVIGLCQSAGSLCGVGAPRVLFVTCWLDNRRAKCGKCKYSSYPIDRNKIAGGGGVRAWTAPTVNTARGGP